MKQHITRAYNQFKINGNTITKLSDNTERLNTETGFYNEILDRPDINIWFPRYINSERGKLSLEYYAYENLGTLMTTGKFDEARWNQIIIQLKNALNVFGRSHIITTDPIQYQMYIDKTLKYYYELIGKVRDFRTIANHSKIKINNKWYSNFDVIWPAVSSFINTKLCSVEPFTSTIIHGDFCFSNILYGITKTDDVVLKFVDPRGNFGNDGIFGDPLYDIAKLRHSFEGGYEYLIYDKFKLELNLKYDEFKLTFANDNKDKIQKLFMEKEMFNIPESKLIQGLIFIGMCSRHYDSMSRQLAMYITGVKLLNESLDQLGISV